MLATLSGCAVTDSISEYGKIEYKSAQKGPSLEVPPDLLTPRGDDRFTVPDRAQERTASAYQNAQAARGNAPGVLAAAPAGVSASSQSGIRIERAGGQRWLVVDQAPDRLWLRVKQFWTDSGFALARESRETGVMETEWAENRAKLPQDWLRRTLGSVLDSVYDSGERDKFRTRLEPAASGGTEIYISHRGMEEVYTTRERSDTRWQNRASDPGLESEFLRRLALALGSTADAAQKLVATAPAPADDKVRLVTVDGQEALELREEFDRAWRRVGLALDRGGFTVEDRDRANGDYFVRYVDSEAEAAATKPGFFSRIFGGAGKAASAHQYRIKLAGSGSNTRVLVLSKEGTALAADIDRQTGARIVSLLRTQLAE